MSHLLNNLRNKLSWHRIYSRFTNRNWQSRLCNNTNARPGVGIVTKPGLPISVGEPAINPMPRKFISEIVEQMAQRFNRKPAVKVTISIPNGDKIAKKTWNSRLGIKNGLSILGTTGQSFPR